MLASLNVELFLKDGLNYQGFLIILFVHTCEEREDTDNEQTFPDTAFMSHYVTHGDNIKYLTI